MSRGVLTRHSPQLLITFKPVIADALPIEDELRFAYYRFGRFWARWALGRALLTRSRQREMVKTWRQVSHSHAPAQPQPLTLKRAQPQKAPTNGSRQRPHPYARRAHLACASFWDQLRYQTVAPCEVIVVDQTPVERRDHALTDDFRICR
ncbi:MAG: hypothetical protein WKF84_20675 [Pyrinomonadaceae bacterium]